MTFKELGVSSAAKIEILSGAIMEPITIGQATPVMFCAQKCLDLRISAGDAMSCNGFMLENGQCKLWYKDPNWIMEQVKNSSDGSEDVGTVYIEMEQHA